MQFCFIFCGTNGTGKTKFALEEFVMKYPKNVIILDPLNGEKKWSIYPVIGETKIKQLSISKPIKAKLDVDFSSNKYWEILMQIKNSLIVFDDFNFFLTYDTRGVAFRDLLLRRRQLNNDIILICHGLSEVPPSFFTFASHLVIFNTTDSYLRLKNKIPNGSEIIAVIEDVKRQAKSNPYAKEIYQLRTLKA